MIKDVHDKQNRTTKEIFLNTNKIKYKSFNICNQPMGGKGEKNFLTTDMKSKIKLDVSLCTLFK